MMISTSVGPKAITGTLEALGLLEQYFHLIRMEDYQELSRKIREEGVALANQMNIGNFRLPYSFDFMINPAESKDKRAERLRQLQDLHITLARIKR